MKQNPTLLNHFFVKWHKTKENIFINKTEWVHRLRYKKCHTMDERKAQPWRTSYKNHTLLVEFPSAGPTGTHKSSARGFKSNRLFPFDSCSNLQKTFKLTSKRKELKCLNLNIIWTTILSSFCLFALCVFVVFFYSLYFKYCKHTCITINDIFPLNFYKLFTFVSRGTSFKDAFGTAGELFSDPAPSNKSSFMSINVAMGEIQKTNYLIKGSKCLLFVPQPTVLSILWCKLVLFF